MDQLKLDVLVTRGNHVESRHRVHAAIVDAQQGLIAEARRADDVVHWRSCAKPFQLMPLIAADGLEKLGWGDDQIALACGSHGGEPEHVAIASQMLTDLGLEEGDLACGPHEPMARRGAKRTKTKRRRIEAGANNGSFEVAVSRYRARNI